MFVVFFLFQTLNIAELLASLSLMPTLHNNFDDGGDMHCAVEEKTKFRFRGLY